jgi:aromatic ring-opening dioxygenase catalytic subunit (LigB family)
MPTAVDLRRMPVIFAAHGAPILLDDVEWMQQLAAWAGAMPKPKCILIVSAHWEARPATLGATRTVPLVHDFYGFPERYYRTEYPAPGAPELAARVRELLRERSIECADDPDRGLDHGAYVPLVAMYPKADVPVLQVSMPALDAEELFELGRALAPLPDEGALVFGSGFLTHNMRFALTSTPGSRTRCPASMSMRSSTSGRVHRASTWRCRPGSTSPRYWLRSAPCRSGCRRSPSRSQGGGWTERSRSGRFSSV